MGEASQATSLPQKSEKQLPPPHWLSLPALCLQVIRYKAFLRDLQAVFREQSQLPTATGESKAQREEAPEAEAVGKPPDASRSLKERSPCVAKLNGIPLAGESPHHQDLTCASDCLLPAVRIT